MLTSLLSSSHLRLYRLTTPLPDPDAKSLLSCEHTREVLCMYPVNVDRVTSRRQQRRMRRSQV